MHENHLKPALSSSHLPSRQSLPRSSVRCRPDGARRASGHPLCFALTSKCAICKRRLRRRGQLLTVGSTHDANVLVTLFVGHALVGRDMKAMASTLMCSHAVSPSHSRPARHHHAITAVHALSRLQIAHAKTAKAAQCSGPAAERSLESADRVNIASSALPAGTNSSGKHDARVWCMTSGCRA